MMNNTIFAYDLRTSIKRILLSLTLIMGFVSHSMYAQATLEGQWKDAEKGIIIEIYETNGTYFGKLISTENQEANQKIQAQNNEIILLRDFQKKSDTKYCCGKIFRPKEDKLISGTLVLENESTLKVIGKYGFFKGSRTWTRV